MKMYALVLSDRDNINKDKIIEISPVLATLSSQECSNEDICGQCEVKDFTVVYDCMCEYISGILSKHGCPDSCDKDFLKWFIWNNKHSFFIDFPKIMPDERRSSEEQRENRVISMYDRQYCDYILECLPF